MKKSTSDIVLEGHYSYLIILYEHQTVLMNYRFVDKINKICRNTLWGTYFVL